MRIESKSNGTVRGPARTGGICLGLLLLLLSAWAASQDGLYGPDAPRDAAWVRLINADPGGGESAEEPLALSVSETEWPPVAFAQVAPYRTIAPGQHRAALAGHEFEFSAEAEDFITIVALPGDVLVLHDTPLQDISRGLLTLYNLTDGEPLTLRSRDGSDILADVASRSAESVAISEAEAELEIYRAGERLASLESRLYRRGEAHSLIVLPLGSDPQVLYVTAESEP